MNRPRISRPAIGYTRVSTEEQARGGVSLDAQEARIRAYCAAQGLTLDGVLIDAGESGKSMDRPQLTVLLERIAAGEVGAVVISKLDRLTRRTRDLLALVEDVFKPGGVELVSLSEQLDTRTPAGVLMLTLLGALAQMEREQIAERTRVALHYKREGGASGDDATRIPDAPGRFTHGAGSNRARDGGVYPSAPPTWARILPGHRGRAY